ncbi:MAG: ABC transporter ATP-binding protein [Firmicutes bacterium]|nr:ABC transporter ATP-binding protein [Bacillota bacterium]
MASEMLKRLSVKENYRNIKQCFHILKQLDPKFFALSGAMQLLSVLIPYITLWLSSFVLDGFERTMPYHKMIIVVLACVVLVFSVQCVKNWLENFLRVRQYRIARLYEYMKQEKLVQMDYSRINSPEVEQILRRIASDQNWGDHFHSIIRGLHNIWAAIFNVIGAVALGLPILKQIIQYGSYEIAVISLILIVVIAIGLKCRSNFWAKIMHYMWSTRSKEELTLGWYFAEDFPYQNGKDIRIYDGTELVKAWTTDLFKRKVVRDNALKYGSLGEGGYAFCRNMLRGAVEGAAYLIVGILAIAGAMSIGSVVRLAGCLRNFIYGFVELICSLDDLGMRAHQQVSTFEFFELEDEMYKGRLPMEKRSDNQYQIEFRDVSFKYPGSQVYALKNFSMKLKIGEKLAIVGMNGSGKTTMIKLLCRLYDPDEGEILLNGVNIKKFKQEEYSTLFSVVFQDYNLFPFKLGQNVALDTHYDVEKVEKCLQDAGFGDRLQEMPEGLDTYLYTDYDDSGVQISGGEAQKIALARAIYKDSPFILLDEPTAALDPLSEYEIYTHFDQIVGSKTAIYISHRLSSCRFCGKIAVFHEGRLVQLGSHKELVADAEGKYYEMWNAQAQYYREQGKGWESLVEEA